MKELRQGRGRREEKSGYMKERKRKKGERVKW